MDFRDIVLDRERYAAHIVSGRTAFEPVMFHLGPGDQHRDGLPGWVLPVSERRCDRFIVWFGRMPPFSIDGSVVCFPDIPVDCVNFR